MKHFLALAAVVFLAAPVQSSPLKSAVKAAAKAAAEAHSVAHKAAHAAVSALKASADLGKAELRVAKSFSELQAALLLLTYEDYSARNSK